MESVLSSSLEAPANQTEILIVDDHPFVRQGMAMYINQERDMQVTGEASDGHEALDLLNSNSYDVVISDIQMEGLGGLSFMSRVKDLHPKVPVVMLSMHDEIQFGIDSLKAGAMGYVMKSENPDRLLEAIRAIRKGDTYFSQTVTRKVIDGYHDRNKKLPTVDNLTPREKQVYIEIGNGLSTKEIAEKLFIARKTVESFKSRIKKKMRFESARELRQHAIKWQNTSGLR